MSPTEAAGKLRPLFQWVNVTAPQVQMEALETEYGPVVYLGGEVPSPIYGMPPCKRDYTLTACLRPGASLPRVAEWKDYIHKVVNILGAHATEGLVVRDTFQTVHKDTPDVELAAPGFRTDRPHIYGISWPGPDSPKG